MTASPDSNEARVSVIESKINGIEADIALLRLEAKETRHEIHEMRTDLAQRPTWAIATVIGTLGSAVVGLLVALANNVP